MPESELRDFYEEKLLPKLELYCEKRRKAWMTVLIVCGSTLLLLAVALVLLISNFSFMSLPVFLTIFIGGFAVVVPGWLIVKHTFKNYKEDIIAPLVKFVSQDLEFYPLKSITKSEFKASRLFMHDIDRFSGEDLVAGVVGSTAIKFSEVHAEYKTHTTNSKGQSSTQWHTIFKGVFFIADFNKKFRSRTVVLPDTAENIFGSLIGKALQKMNVSRSEKLVQLEDPEFEKLFAVYSSDQIESRYILSPALMKRIVDLRRKRRWRTYISFTGSNVNIALETKRNMFEPRLFSDLKDFSMVEEYYNDLSSLVSIVDELNLNNRIWTKE